MAVFTFEGPAVLYVHATLAAAEGYFEAIDVEEDEYVFFADDGTVLDPSVRDGRVVLTRTDQRRPAELAERLRTYLEGSRVALDPSLADDPVTLGELVMAQEAPERVRWWRLRRR